jgi:AcrR family transcriptional regulator
MKYESAQETRTALIEAAGELFSLRGYAEVTTREIAKSACENIGSIHYHFGGKEGLLEAVLEYTLGAWKSDPFGKYLKERESLLKTKAGRSEFVDGLIDLFFDLTFSPGGQEWQTTFCFQMLQRKIPGCGKILKDGVAPMAKAFTEVYRRITGSDDYMAAHVWFHHCVSSAFMITLNPAPAASAFPEGRLPDSYTKTLREHCRSCAKFGLGLL